MNGNISCSLFFVRYSKLSSTNAFHVTNCGKSSKQVMIKLEIEKKMSPILTKRIYIFSFVLSILTMNMYEYASLACDMTEEKKTDVEKATSTTNKIVYTLNTQYTRMCKVLHAMWWAIVNKFYGTTFALTHKTKEMKMINNEIQFNISCHVTNIQIIIPIHVYKIRCVSCGLLGASYYISLLFCI